MPIKNWLAKNKNKLTTKVLFFIYLTILIYSTLAPELILEDDFEWTFLHDFKNVDKIVHFVLFFILTIVYYIAYIPKKLIYHIGVPFAISFIIECLQYIMPFGRMFDFKDLLANFFGVIFATYINQKVISPLIKTK